MRGNRVGALLVVCLLIGTVGSAGGAGATGSTESPVYGPLEELDVTEESDEVYVAENGDAVLVYDHPHNATPLEGTVGVNTETGLAHARYAGELEEAAGFTGDVTLRTDQNDSASAGDLRIAETESITDLEAAIDVRQTDRESTSSGDVQATVTDRELAYSSVRSEGTLEVAGGSLTGSGTIHTTAHNDTAWLAGTNASLELTVTEATDGYALAVTERRPIEEWERERWNTRADAHESLQNRFSSAAIELGGTANGTLESYRFTDGDEQAIVEYSYDVTYVGVDDRVAEVVVAQIQQRTNTELTEAESRVLADRIESTRLERLWIDVDRNGPKTAVEWELEASGYDQLVLGTVEVAESIDRIDDSVVDQFDIIRATLETRKETDLRQTASWNVSIDDDGTQTAIDATWRSDAENWQTYTTALEERGLSSLVPETTVTIDARTTADGLGIVYNYETAADGALDRTIDELEGTAAGASDVVATASALHETFETAEHMKADVTVDNGTYALEAAAANPDVAFEIAAISDQSGLSVSAIHAESDEHSSTVYVTVDEYVSGEPTKEAVRDREQVGDDTAVYMPGEWDREFPRVDSERVATILDVDLDDEDADNERLGIAVSLALVGGLIAVALVGFYGVRQWSLSRSDGTRTDEQ
ncbi:hypothetical protein [Natronorubrum aibiense]|uniref:PGF-CTERM sorting domain-containing protein n=1 Tax=Natronorubrum aibiense TaxID=348826 RepID=A0A5P9P923_9EURY|nr:hypothetical protein [Natronorubrum aibiense]QFU84608.1 hypothetical protein GCU68_18905 [Natronorubrum aibiense]